VFISEIAFRVLIFGEEIKNTKERSKEIDKRELKF
jgi:hypothetical protein